MRRSTIRSRAVTARLTSEPGLAVRLSAAESAEAGGKAASLARLVRLGVAVPDGWVLTLRADRLRRCGQLPDGALDSLIRDRLLAWHPAAERFAIRSSADTEDSAQASYAGQFRTELNVLRDDVPGAVRRVAASAGNPSARSYARRLGVRAPEAMAVLVQEQVNARLSGVCFTVHPVTGAPALVLEYASGLGGAVVSGGELAGSYVLPRLPGRGFTERQFAAAGPVAARWLREMALLAVQLEAMLCRPQDVEWAVDGRRLWVLQVRPITTIGAAPASRTPIGRQT